MSVVIAVLAGFVLAAAAPWLYRLLRGATGWVLALLPAGLAVLFAASFAAVDGGPLVISYPWVPSLGVSLSFYLDGLSLLFALLISGIGALVVIYAGAYLAGQPRLSRFYTLILMFMSSMLGVVLAGNLITMFVFWELTSVTSYLLIGMDHDRLPARAAARQALLVTNGGGLDLMAGLLLIGLIVGSLDLPVLLASGDALRNHPLYVPVLLLILLGAFTKSAQMPFHFWLPNAMEAPTPVSAYLHSATMVKAGVYLLARFSPVLGGTEIWHTLLTGVGLVTMLVAAAIAVAQTDFKRILAYSTVSALGSLVLLVGQGTPLAAQAAMLFLFVHALYKGALFLVAGAVDHETGTRDVTRLGGLAWVMPVTAVAAGLAALSMAGLPPLLGFVNKELLYEASLHAPRGAGWLTAAGVATNALLVAVAGLVVLRPFAGRLAATPRKPHEAPLGLWLGPVVLGGLALLGGLLPGAVPSALVSSAASAVRAETIAAELKLWHGVTPVLGLSLLTLALGVALYAGVGFFRRGRLPAVSWVGAAVRTAGRWGPERWYDWTLGGVDALARVQTRVLQSGYLSNYLIVIIATTVGLAGYTLVSRGGLNFALDRPVNIRLYEALLAVWIIAAAVMAVRSTSRLAAVAALGAVGYGVALIFALFSAPDLAMTQFAVETLTVFVMVLVLYRLPRFVQLSTRAERTRDAILAGTVGIFMAALVLIATATPLESELAAFFTATSLTLGKGRNIVNVILVDFRGFDTMGEITVLSAAAIGVAALLSLRRER